MSSVELSRRQAGESDTEFARMVHHQAYREVVERQFGSWIEADQDQFFKGDWTPARFDVVSCDGVPCGYLSVEDRSDAVIVREIVILPPFQGKGIGSSLLRDVIEHARRRQVPVSLGTFHQNRALALYLRLGFREIGRTHTHVLLEWNDPNGTATDTVGAI